MSPADVASLVGIARSSFSVAAGDRGTRSKLAR